MSICIFCLHCFHLCFSDPLNNLRGGAQTKTFPGLMVRCQGSVNACDSPKVLQLGSGRTQHGIWGLLLVFFLHTVPHPTATVSAEACSALKTGIAFVGFILEEFGAGFGDRTTTAVVVDVIGGTKKGVHQRGLCQRLNFLYFRTGSYLNDFIDFLFPCKSSLSSG